ncbi:MAG: DUF1600 domain-containing protein [Mycoplasma sp.]
MRNEQRVNIYKKSIDYSKAYIFSGIQLLVFIFLIVFMSLALVSFSKYDVSLINNLEIIISEELSISLPKYDAAVRLWFIFFSCLFLLSSYASFYYNFKLKSECSWLIFSCGLFGWALFPYFVITSYKNQYFREFLFSLKRDDHMYLSISHSNVVRCFRTWTFNRLFWNTILFYFTYWFVAVGVILMFFWWDKSSVGDAGFVLITDKLWNLGNLTTICTLFYLSYFWFSHKSCSHNNNSKITIIAAFYLVLFILYWSYVLPNQVSIKSFDVDYLVTDLWTHAIVPIIFIWFAISCMIQSRNKPMGKFWMFQLMGMIIPTHYMLFAIILPFVAPYSAFGRVTNLNNLSTATGPVMSNAPIHVLSILGILTAYFAFLALFYYIADKISKKEVYRIQKHIQEEQLI